MGVLSWLRGDDLVQRATNTVPPSPAVDDRTPTVRTARFTAPPSDTYATSWTYSVTGYNTVGRDQAMSLGVVANARQLIAGTGGQLPLSRYRNDVRLDPGSLLTQPDPDAPRSVTLAWTIDSLCFYGTAYWLILARDAEGFPLTCRWIDPMAVEYRPLTQARYGPEAVQVEVLYRGRKIDPRDLIRFDGPHEGWLRYGARILATGIDLDSQVRKFAQVPVPLQKLMARQGTPLPDLEQQQTIIDRVESETRRGSGTLFLGNVDLEPAGVPQMPDGMAEARMQTWLAIAQMCGVPADVLSVNVAGQSLTYQNLAERNRSLLNLTVDQYLVAIEERLSRNDVTARGQQVRFDRSLFVRPSQQEWLAYVLTMRDAGLVDDREARSLLGLGPTMEVPADV